MWPSKWIFEWLYDGYCVVPIKTRCFLHLMDVFYERTFTKIKMTTKNVCNENRNKKWMRKWTNVYRKCYHFMRWHFPEGIGNYQFISFQNMASIFTVGNSEGESMNNTLFIISCYLFVSFLLTSNLNRVSIFAVYQMYTVTYDSLFPFSLFSLWPRLYYSRFA